MAFGINTDNAERVRSYEDAARLFEKPANLRRMGWGENRRPLDGVRKLHMRVERGPDAAYFDVVLYRTAMARYFKPVDVTRDVWHNVHGSQSSSTFQWSVLGFSPSDYTKTTTEGKRVLVGMNPNGSGVFPVRLHLVNGKLDVANSTDAPAQLRNTTSPERKTERRAFIKWLRPYEAMSKIMDGGRLVPTWQLVTELKRVYITKELFDPTDLCTYIRSTGIARVVNAVFPLGDVDNYNPAFKELP
jgi:hypothetical protein